MTASDPADFGGALPTGTITFAAGETTRTVTVNVSGDTTLEPDENFTVLLSNASSGLAISSASAAATIVNDDASVSIAALSPILAEGSDLTFTLARTGDLSMAQTVAYTVSGSASASDFAGGILPSGTIVNDDTTVSIAAPSEDQPEGVPFTFTLTRTGDLSGAQSVTWSVAGFGAGSANAASAPLKAE